MKKKPVDHLTKRLLSVFGIFLLFLAASCTPTGEQPPEDLPAVIESEPEISPTATIDWFPATATFTPLPTALPTQTPIPLPGLGAQTYSDDFSTISNWFNARAEGNGSNSIILGRNRLTFAANVPPVYLSSQHNGLALTDFYAEVTASVHRCMGNDSYGMLFRAAGEFYAYRFSLNCSGQTRVERMRGGEVYPLSEWVLSGDVPPGAPGEARLGVWVSGVEMRFFLNDHYQFSVFDPVFHNGTLGLFINAESPFGMNVSFADLQVFSVDYLSPTPTMTPSRTPTATRTPFGTP